MMSISEKEQFIPLDESEMQDVEGGGVFTILRGITMVLKLADYAYDFYCGYRDYQP